MALSPDFLSYGYSMIVMLGGVIGYAKAGWCLLINQGCFCQIIRLKNSTTGVSLQPSFGVEFSVA